MKKLGIDAPLVGYLLQSGRLESGAVVDITNWGNPKLEPEIVARVGEDGEISAIGAAIELADLDPGAGDPEEILAANIFQRHVLLGPVTEGASDGRRRAAGGRQRRGGRRERRRHRGDGRPRRARRATSPRRSKAAGESLERGDMVICGSIVPALDVAPGDEVEVSLEPLGSLTVSFASCSTAHRRSPKRLRGIRVAARWISREPPGPA